MGESMLTTTEESAGKTHRKTAVLYRMETPDHICPFGLKSRDLLQREGYYVEDHKLETRAETDVFKAKYDVKTTPQTFIRDVRIGGYTDLREFFGLRVKTGKETSYRPIISIFVMAFLMALAMTAFASTGFAVMSLLEHFIAISMCILAIQKMQNLDSFANTFLGYDLLARRHVRYAYVYPFAEGLAGVLMLAGVLTWLSAPIALFIGSIGAVSVYKAVYIEKRSLKCACVGVDSNVPLGFVSLTENVMMVAMALWMIAKAVI